MKLTSVLRSTPSKKTKWIVFAFMARQTNGVFGPWQLTEAKDE